MNKVHIGESYSLSLHHNHINHDLSYYLCEMTRNIADCVNEAEDIN